MLLSYQKLTNILTKLQTLTQRLPKTIHLQLPQRLSNESSLYRQLRPVYSDATQLNSTRRRVESPSPLLAVPNVTAHPSTASLPTSLAFAL